MDILSLAQSHTSATDGYTRLQTKAAKDALEGLVKKKEKGLELLENSCKIIREKIHLVSA